MQQLRQLAQLFGILLAALMLSGISKSPLAGADSTAAPNPVISQLKMTSSNGQFITLYNSSSNSLDMGRYELEYFNSYDLSKATSSKLIALSGTVPAHGYFMVNDSSLLLCYQLTVDSVSLGLSSTAGMVELLALNQTSPGASVTPQLLDYVAWSKTAVSGAQTLPTNTSAFLQRQPLDSQNNPAVSTPGTGSWLSVQPDAANPCTLVSGNTSKPVPSGLSQLLPATEPPVSFIGSADQGSSGSGGELPSDDIGLMAPVVNELLPNPAGSGTDSTDEFVELYNPNQVAFDLSSFELQAGTTTVHTYIFPAGASLPAQSFVAFYASTTGLSLSNTGGQVKLLDPGGNSISASDSYGTAGDGQAWALAKGIWYWTTTPTPSAANAISQPADAKSSSKSTTSKTVSSGKVKAAKTAKPKAKTSAKLAATTSSGDAPSTPIHTSVLALVAGLALLYGAYEYRWDIGNIINKLRKHRTASGTDRTTATRR